MSVDERVGEYVRTLRVYHIAGVCAEYLNHSMLSSSGGSAEASISNTHFNAPVLGTCRAGRTAMEGRPMRGVRRSRKR